jgi:hypothetical protein
MVCGDRIREVSSCSSVGSSLFMKLPKVARSAECRHVGILFDRLCDLVVRVPVYRSRGPWFDSRLYQIF